MDEHLNPVQFGNYTIKHDDLKYRTVRADTPSGRNIGYLMWEKPGEHNGNRPTISSVRVSKPQQGKGVAGAMLEHALAYEPDLQHSHALTDDGKRFAQRHPL
jgi:GNAT superfamily N-acetyltransferase